MTKLQNYAVSESDKPLIEKLSEDHRRALTHGGTTQEMAADFGWPIGTAKSRTHRARKALIALRAAQPTTAEV